MADSVAALADAVTSLEDYHCCSVAAGPSSLMATGAALAWIDCQGVEFAQQRHFPFGKSSAYLPAKAEGVAAAGVTAPPRYLGNSQCR